MFYSFDYILGFIIQFVMIQLYKSGNRPWFILFFPLLNDLWLHLVLFHYFGEWSWIQAFISHSQNTTDATGASPSWLCENTWWNLTSGHMQWYGNISYVQKRISFIGTGPAILIVNQNNKQWQPHAKNKMVQNSSDFPLLQCQCCVCGNFTCQGSCCSNTNRDTNKCDRPEPREMWRNV